MQRFGDKAGKGEHVNELALPQAQLYLYNYEKKIPF
jgi:hypothetical protein